MNRLSVSCVLVIAGVAAAQDMPLHEIIKPGESWKLAAGDMPARPKGGYTIELQSHRIVLDGKPMAVSLEKRPRVQSLSAGRSYSLPMRMSGTSGHFGLRRTARSAPATDTVGCESRVTSGGSG